MSYLCHKTFQQHSEPKSRFVTRIQNNQHYSEADLVSGSNYYDSSYHLKLKLNKYWRNNSPSVFKSRKGLGLNVQFSPPT